MKFKLLAKESGQKSNLVLISVFEIFFILGFSVKRQKSLFTFESFCIILANSFFQELPNLCQSAIFATRK